MRYRLFKSNKNKSPFSNLKHPYTYTQNPHYGLLTYYTPTRINQEIHFNNNIWRNVL